MSKIKIYTTSTCPYCDLVKEHLDEKKLKYEELNIESNEDLAKEMVKKSGQMGVPVVEINNKIIVGVNKEEIDKALEKN